jgi:hypothetical protein
MIASFITFCRQFTCSKKFRLLGGGKMKDYLVKKIFAEINLNDPFFDSLKVEYQEFETWFERKKSEEAYILYKEETIDGFLYCKFENGPITDIEPNIQCQTALKIGTMKINPHKTRLGERFIKKALDSAIVMNVDLCYVTVFQKHEGLLRLFQKYGFTLHGNKSTNNGQELVLVKSFAERNNDILLDYHLICVKDANKYILSIYPEYHSNMFPDSIL